MIPRWRAFLGCAALVLGGFGFLLFLLGVPLTVLGAHFFGGFGFREGPQPTAEQLNAAVSRQFWWAVWHRLVPLLVLSLTALGYGLFEIAPTKRKRHDDARA